MSAAIYRLLLLAYPPAFRRKFGTAMAADFADCYRARIVQGSLGGLSAWRIVFKDLLMSAPRERMAVRKKPPASGAGHHVPAGGSSASPNRSPGRISRFDDVIADIKFGARALRRQPGFTAVAILTLGLGIGAPGAEPLVEVRFDPGARGDDFLIDGCDGQILMEVLSQIAVPLGIDRRLDAAQQIAQLFVDRMVRFLRREHRRTCQ